ncbi:putative transcriptional regulator [Halorubrum alkaliphilum]|uniref:Putative transcriptional regulator n=2 Tax=Halorubrum alkaliphilum TaxID=261290 RepID=A0A8T4GKQ6_9EURY|nr:putative transcriptional regulator [Halorubrum alkaliphilum]
MNSPHAVGIRDGFYRVDTNPPIRMAATRERIRRYVHETPGVHFNRLGRDLDLATGQVQYHLRRLTRSEAVVAESVGGRTHYFPPEYDPWERRLVAYLRRETTRAILVRLHANGPARPVDLAEELDVARSTVAYHVSNLDDAGAVVRSPDEPMRVSLAEPDRTAELLDTVSPSLPDRVVDRFVRTVDRLFE